MKTLIRILLCSVGFLVFSSQSTAQEVRLGFSIGAGFNFLPNATGFDAAFAPSLPRISLEIAVLQSLWVRIQLAPFILVNEAIVDLKYCFMDANNTAYIGIGGGWGLYFMAGGAPIVRAFAGYQLDWGSSRVSLEVFTNPFDFTIGPRIGLQAGITFRS